MEALTLQLRNFCVLVDNMKYANFIEVQHMRSVFFVVFFSIGVSLPKSKPPGATLYPNLLDDYSVITSEDSWDIQKLLPIAGQLTTALHGNISSLEAMFHKSQKGNVNAAIMQQWIPVSLF